MLLVLLFAFCLYAPKLQPLSPPGERVRERGGGRYWTRTSDLHDVNVAL
jgi:hypothetical protein